MPRLPRFHQAHPHLDVSLVTSERAPGRPARRYRRGDPVRRRSFQARRSAPAVSRGGVPGL
ncbi:hypothetical protein [Pseudomonas aeruginosa]|uniref:hypothetical protein n=1 Tax=Pseudomonas aeruginosa TaxID=287 RepID=UPI003D010F3E